MTFLNFLISGISLGSIYAIIALGYTMVYGIAKMLNFAHGDVIMVGAYICFYAVSRFDLPPLAGVILAMLVCTVLGMVVERLAYKPLRQAPSLAVLITAIGVSYFLQNMALLLWSSNPKVFPGFFVSASGDTGVELFGGELKISYVTLFTILICIVIMLALTPPLLALVELTPGAQKLLLGMMVIMAFYMIGRAVNTVIINGIFAAGGDTAFDMYSLCVCMWGLAVPLAALGAFVFHWHVLVVYACME